MKRETAPGTRKKRDRVITGRPRTKQVSVAHPTLPGAVEKVERVYDGAANTIESMFRRGQIDAQQHRAAERLRTAWDTVYGSVGGVMDFEKVRGSGGGGMPADPYRYAADDLNTAKTQLYALDHRVLMLVVCEGYRIDSAAALVYGTNSPTRAHKERIGDRFREGLRELAERWYGAPVDAKVRAYHAPGATSFASEPSGIRQIESGPAHATGHKVFRKG